MLVKHWFKLHIYKLVLILFLCLAFFTNDSFLRSRPPETFTFFLLFHYVLYGVGYCLCIFSLYVALLQKKHSVRIIFEILAFTSLFMEVFYLLIAGRRFIYFDAINLTNNLHYSESAIQNFYLQAFLALILTLIIYWFLARVLNRIEKIYSPMYLLLIPTTYILVYFFSLTSVASLDSFPVTFRAPVSLLLSKKKSILNVQRAKVNLQATDKGLQHVTLIVDESVSAEYISLNSMDTSLTPFLWNHRNDILNFGKASSFTNYSAGSNVALYSGAVMSDLPDKNILILQKPNIFQFAKKAGYTTYFIDAQTQGGNTQNFMSGYDFMYIDYFIQCPLNTSPYNKDFVLADSLLNIMNSNNKTFVYFNKFGAHWPYHEGFPEKKNGKKKFLNFTSKAEIIEDYKQNIQWTVDKFWKKLMLENKTIADGVTLYTSDHGQNFTSSIMRHGSIYNVNPNEAAVPIWIYPKYTISKYSKILTTKNNTASHQNIFPTLLLFMGYSAGEVEKIYAQTLFTQKSISKRYFLSGDIFGRSTSEIMEFN